MRMKEIRSKMCEEGWPTVRGVKNTPNPLSCAECESMCLGGLEYLKKIKEDEFQALLCGGDCENCRQPCNLRRIALMRKIKPMALLVRPKERKPKSENWWLDIAMRPYIERSRHCGNDA